MSQAKANRETFDRCLNEAKTLFKEKGISPDLWDRVALGRCLRLPGFEYKLLDDLREEAYKARCNGEIKYGWYRIAKYVKLCFEKAGIPWEKCRSPKEVFLDEQHEKRINKPGTGADPQQEPAPAEHDPEAAAQAAADCRREVMENARKVEAEQKAAAELARERRAKTGVTPVNVTAPIGVHRPPVEQQNVEEIPLPKLKSATEAVARSSPKPRKPPEKPAGPHLDAMAKRLQKIRDEHNNPKPHPPDPGLKFVKSKAKTASGRKSA